MKSKLTTFLQDHTPLFTSPDVWANGRLPIEATFYLTTDLPPLDYVTSVRAIVFRGDAVMIVRTIEDKLHIVPGGRREKGETIEETLSREVLEETGWTLAHRTLLGFAHFHHNLPQPANAAYPPADFIQLIYIAEAGKFIPDAPRIGDHEQEAGFHPISQAPQLLIEPEQQHLLEIALNVRSSTLSA